MKEQVNPCFVLVGIDGDCQHMACRVVVQVEEGAAFPFDLKCAVQELDGTGSVKRTASWLGPRSMLCTFALSSR